MSFPNVGGRERDANVPDKCRECYFGRESKTTERGNVSLKFSESELREYLELVKKYTVGDEAGE